MADFTINCDKQISGSDIQRARGEKVFFDNRSGARCVLRSTPALSGGVLDPGESDKVARGDEYRSYGLSLVDGTGSVRLTIVEIRFIDSTVGFASVSEDDAPFYSPTGAVQIFNDRGGEVYITAFKKDSPDKANIFYENGAATSTIKLVPGLNRHTIDSNAPEDETYDLDLADAPPLDRTKGYIKITKTF
ncbi:MAG: hypothetical protein R3B70_18235 [Polyangiaceae bacterium]